MLGVPVRPEPIPVKSPAKLVAVTIPKFKLSVVLVIPVTVPAMSPTNVVAVNTPVVSSVEAVTTPIGAINCTLV
jgi:hypothetical protein